LAACSANGLCATGLHLGEQIATCTGIIRCVTVGDSDQRNTDCASTFLRKIEKALPGITFKTGELCGFASSLGIFERECKTLPLALLNNEADDVSIGGTFGGKTYLHLETAFQRLGSEIRGIRSACVLANAISKHSARIKAKDGCGNQGLASMSYIVC
jgi:hypothetical protein